jgi:hypothetical protein
MEPLGLCCGGPRDHLQSTGAAGIAIGNWRSKILCYCDNNNMKENIKQSSKNNPSLGVGSIAEMVESCLLSTKP